MKKYSPVSKPMIIVLDRSMYWLHIRTFNICYPHFKGLKEHKAHDFLCDFLEKHGFEVERHYLLDTAFRATYRKGTGPHVAVLCEFDALPEIGHACGHNLIAEAGAGAGLAIKAAMAAAKENMGTVRVGVVTKLMMAILSWPWAQNTIPRNSHEWATRPPSFGTENTHSTTTSITPPCAVSSCGPHLTPSSSPPCPFVIIYLIIYLHSHII